MRREAQQVEQVEGQHPCFNAFRETVISNYTTSSPFSSSSFPAISLSPPLTTPGASPWLGSGT